MTIPHRRTPVNHRPEPDPLAALLGRILGRPPQPPLDVQIARIADALREHGDAGALAADRLDDLADEVRHLHAGTAEQFHDRMMVAMTPPEHLTPLVGPREAR